MKLWLDDIRPMPEGYDYWAKTADEAISYISAHKVDHCSLDHDLSTEHYNRGSNCTEKTGYSVILWMEESNTWVPDISIHTMNGVGGERMIKAIQHSAPWVRCRRVIPPFAEQTQCPKCRGVVLCARPEEHKCPL